MRQKRAKAYRKQMLVYNHTFKFREPYQIIVDDQLVLTAEKQSFDLSKGLNRTVQAEVKPMITQCCMQALYQENNQPAIEMARTFERRRCNHNPKEPLPPHECIKSIVIINNQNKHRYIVASENEKLRWSLRKVPGIPLIYMNRSVMVMEPLSKASAQVSNNMESAKLTKGLNSVGPENNDESNDANKLVKKRKGPKEPNPLSIKKKKPENGQNNNNNDDGQKKKRRRKHKKHTEGDGEGETQGEESNQDAKEPEPKEQTSVSDNNDQKNNETSD